jgi:hypothetical protein
MKSIPVTEQHLVQNTKLSRVLGRLKNSNELKERAMTDVVLSIGFAVIVLLYVVMLVGLYRWSHYAPIFPPDGEAGPALEDIAP